MISRRSLLSDSMRIGALIAGRGASITPKAEADPGCGEILGQGAFRYRANRHWGLLDRTQRPVKDCHAITEDRYGRILLLTNDTHNNFIAYTKSGGYLAAWENRFPAAHALEIYHEHGEERY